MKAILIIDVKDNTKFDKAIADITFHDLDYNLPPINIGVRKWYQNVQLKPLPKKKEVKGDFYKQREIAMNMNDLIDFDKGYNKCIDEILGEEE